MTTIRKPPVTHNVDCDGQARNISFYRENTVIHHVACDECGVQTKVFPENWQAMKRWEKMCMGCDIHLHAEIKINDRWEHAGEISRFPRNYEVFGAMAVCGRNDDSPPLVPNKGTPEDCNPLTFWHMENIDYHSHSWLNKSEIDNLYDWFQNNNLQDQMDIFDMFFEGYKNFEYRLVFAFDN